MNSKLSSRTMLRGLGVSMALPWMESLTAAGMPALAGATAAEPPLRLAVVFAGNGFHSQELWAKGTGTDMKLGKVLEPVADFREKLLFVVLFKDVDRETSRRKSLLSDKGSSFVID